MTIVFKHMTRENAERLARGEIRVGSFTYYQDAEHATAIRDELEGITVGRVAGTTVLTSASPEPNETIVAGLKFVTQSGGMIDISNTTFVRALPPLYIYSTSLVGDVGHFQEYDTVVRINDIEQFGRILVDGRRDIFKGYWANRVRYEPRAYGALNHPGIEPDPFTKDGIFAPDEEFRLVFMPAGEVEQQVTFSLDSIRQSFKDGLCEILR